MTKLILFQNGRSNQIFLEVTAGFDCRIFLTPNICLLLVLVLASLKVISASLRESSLLTREASLVVSMGDWLERLRFLI